MTAITHESEQYYSYMETIKKFKILPLEKELELGKAYFENGCLNSIRILITHNLRMVAHFARQYRNQHNDIMELIQEGNIGLMKAAKKYDYKQGVRLATFAAIQIRTRIMDFILRKATLINKATTHAQRKIYYNHTKFISDTSKVTDEELNTISRELDVCVNDVKITLNKMLPTRSIHDDTDIIGEQIQQRSYESIDIAPIMQKVLANLNLLDERRRDVITSRFLSNECEPLSSIAKRYNISIERVRQLEVTALKTLREALTDCDYEFGV